MSDSTGTKALKILEKVASGNQSFDDETHAYEIIMGVFSDVKSLFQERDQLRAELERLNSVLDNQKLFGQCQFDKVIELEDELEKERERVKAADFLCYCLVHDGVNLPKASDKAFSEFMDSALSAGEGDQKK